MTDRKPIGDLVVEKLVTSRALACVIMGFLAVSSVLAAGVGYLGIYICLNLLPSHLPRDVFVGVLGNAVVLAGLAVVIAMLSLVALSFVKRREYITARFSLLVGTIATVCIISEGPALSLIYWAHKYSIQLGVPEQLLVNLPAAAALPILLAEIALVTAAVYYLLFSLARQRK